MAAQADGKSAEPAGMSMAELQELPVSFDLVTAGRAFRIGRTKAHQLARAGDFPCPVLRVGQAYEQATPWHTRRPPV